ncbi:hypothetical protein ACFFX0_05890 [Citricoccus parietis]|uniref:Uncharacterized protein n=1 Tax=Citricoccus parietis TaxID=592307 RepID=A0ABV5FVR7_9MICC
MPCTMGPGPFVGVKGVGWWGGGGERHQSTSLANPGRWKAGSRLGGS